MKTTSLLIHFLLFFIMAFPLKAEEILLAPKKATLVTDKTNTLLQKNASKIEDNLKIFHNTYGYPVVLVIINTCEEVTIEEYANELYNSWGIGSAESEEGVLLLIAMDDRKLRIEVGYGSESSMPDAYAIRIIDDIIVPNFKDYRYEEGILYGLSSITSVLEPGFAWDYSGLYFHANPNGIVVPISPPTIWDPQNLLDDGLKEDIQSTINLLETNPLKIYFAVAPVDSYKYEVSSTIERAFQSAAGFENEYCLITYFAKDQHFLTYEINSASFDKLSYEEYSVVSDSIFNIWTNTATYINNGDVASGINYYIEALYVPVLEAIQKDRKRHFWTIFFIIIGILIFILFLVLMSIIAWKSGASGSSTYSSSGYKSTSSWNSGYSFGSGSGGGYSSFGGGGSGGGGASGSW